MATTDFSPFGARLMALCERTGVSVWEVARRVGISQSRITYALRPYYGDQRSALLTLEQLQAISRLLVATAEERQDLILLGLKEYVPPVLRQHYERVERENEQLRVSLGRAPARRSLRGTQTPPSSAT